MHKNPKLTSQQRDVLFNKATEQPFSGALLDEKDDGSFSCANCGTVLFDSESKYDSGSGWPSFDRAVEGAITTSEDTAHGTVRTEISCATCGGHLGHLFPDGPSQTTGERYCVNSSALNFASRTTKTD